MVVEDVGSEIGQAVSNVNKYDMRFEKNNQAANFEFQTAKYKSHMGWINNQTSATASFGTC